MPEPVAEQVALALLSGTTAIREQPRIEEVKQQARRLLAQLSHQARWARYSRSESNPAMGV